MQSPPEPDLCHLSCYGAEYYADELAELERLRGEVYRQGNLLGWTDTEEKNTCMAAIVADLAAEDLRQWVRNTNNGDMVARCGTCGQREEFDGEEFEIPHELSCVWRRAVEATT